MERIGVAVALLVGCAAVWGSNVIVGRAVAFEVPPIGLAFWRNVFALVVILPFTAAELYRSWALLRGNWGVLLTTAVPVPVKVTGGSVPTPKLMAPLKLKIVAWDWLATPNANIPAAT